MEVVLQVGKSPYTDPYLITNVLSLRLPYFPTLQVEVTSKVAVELSHDLLNGTLDLAFLTGLPDTPPNHLDPRGPPAILCGHAGSR